MRQNIVAMYTVCVSVAQGVTDFLETCDFWLSHIIYVCMYVCLYKCMYVCTIPSYTHTYIIQSELKCACGKCLCPRTPCARRIHCCMQLSKHTRIRSCVNIWAVCLLLHMQGYNKIKYREDAPA